MYKLDVVVDTREAAALERRRNMEKQRQSRIFNARERTIGVSKNLIATKANDISVNTREMVCKYFFGSWIFPPWKSRYWSVK